MWFGEYFVKVGHVTDVSLYGMRIGAPHRVPHAFMKRGKRYRVEVRVDGRWQIKRLVEVRNVSQNGIGLKILRPIPRRLLVLLLLSLAAASGSMPTATVPSPPSRGPHDSRGPLPAGRPGDGVTVVLPGLLARRA